MRICSAACALILLGAWPSDAQEARFSPVAIDTSMAIDRAVDQNGNSTGNIFLDTVGSVRIGSRFEAVVRPYLQRLTNGEWNWQVWEAEIRYERPGPVGLRIDGGLIPSPVGYANLQLRPHLNPTIAQPASLFQPLPLLDVAAPRTTLLGAVYANGVSATVSGRHWDARSAVIDTSPMRTRRTFGYPTNPRFANVVFGAGVTPITGLRIGTSVTHGGWLKEGWFVQGRQTLAPRWFAAGRVERMASDAATSAGYTRQYLTGVEEVLAFRITPEITIRGGHRARQTFGRDTFTHAAEVSVVWAKRWF
jgi:hypothetical protein